MLQRLELLIKISLWSLLYLLSATLMSLHFLQGSFEKEFHWKKAFQKLQAYDPGSKTYMILIYFILCAEMVTIAVSNRAFLIVTNS